MLTMAKKECGAKNLPLAVECDGLRLIVKEVVDMDGPSVNRGTKGLRRRGLYGIKNCPFFISAGGGFN